MRILELAREIWASARGQKVSTILVALLTAAMCATTLMTVGRAAAAEQQLQARMEAAGARELAFTDSNQKGFLTRDVIAQVGGLNITERAVGLTSAIDVTTTATSAGNRVASWQVIGDIDEIATLTWGRWPEPGEAIASVTALNALGLDYPAGSVTTTTGDTYPIVGQYNARAPFTEMNAGVLISAHETTNARTLRVLATTAEAVPGAKAGVLAILSQPNENVRIDSPADIAKLQADLTGDLEAYGRSLLLLVLAAGALLTAIVVLADVLLHRTDLGRRRALGAPRWIIVTLVAGRSAAAGALGAIIGTSITGLILHQTGNPPDLAFAIATALLATLAAALAALPPAVAAAHQDPIHVLRTP